MKVVGVLEGPIVSPVGEYPTGQATLRNLSELALSPAESMISLSWQCSRTGQQSARIEQPLRLYRDANPVYLKSKGAIQAA